MLQPEKCISQNSLRDYLRRIGNQAGLLALVLPHDLRRGSGRDVSRLPNSVLPGNTDVVAASVMGHSYKSMFLGVTATCVGATKVDYWTKRV